jgi:hypothetical protein
MTPQNYTAVSTGAAANAATFNNPLDQLDDAIGAAVSTLTTTAKTVVGSLNELDAQIGAAASSSGTLGTSIDTDGTLKAGAVDGSTILADTIITDAKLAADVKIGSLAALNTTTKASVVAAINELVDLFSGLTAPSSLIESLESYWTLDEASGDRNDSVGTNHLTESDTGTIAGKIGNATTFVGTNVSGLTIADNASLSTGDIDFTLAAWVKINTKAAANYSNILVSKLTDGTHREYVLGYEKNANRFFFYIANAAGTVSGKVYADTLGAVSDGVWYYIIAWHNQTANKVCIVINDQATPDETATSDVPANTTAAFYIGRYGIAPNSSNGDHTIDEVGFWKRLLTSDEMLSLYNSGAGLDFLNNSFNTIVVSSPTAYQVFQRNTNDLADITISGTYIGNPSAIEASWGGPFVTIDDTPSAGTFSGTLPDQNTGQNTLIVRFTNNSNVSTSVRYIGVGDVFAVAGQSNASCFGTNNQAYSKARLRPGFYGKDYLWHELADPFDINTGAVDVVSNNGNVGNATGLNQGTPGGSWMHKLAMDYMANQFIPIAFIPCALGGSGINLWAPGANHQDRTTLYGAMVYRCLQTGGVKAVLWWQGEHEFSLGTTAAAYKTALGTLANTVDADLGVKLIPCKLEDLSAAAGGPYDEGVYNTPIGELWTTNSHIAAGPDFSDITPSVDGVHFKTDAELTTAGGRWWTAIKTAFGW